MSCVPLPFPPPRRARLLTLPLSALQDPRRCRPDRQERHLARLPAGYARRPLRVDPGRVRQAQAGASLCSSSAFRDLLTDARRPCRSTQVSAATPTSSRSSRRGRSLGRSAVATCVSLSLLLLSGSGLIQSFCAQSVSLSGRSGFLFPLSAVRSPSTSSSSSSSSPRTSLFPDRYHLGGPTSVRNFRLNALGPKDLGDYVGGDAFYALGASVLTPFHVPTPWRKGADKKWWSSENLHGHAWVNAGKLVGSGASHSRFVVFLGSPALRNASLTAAPLARSQASPSRPSSQPLPRSRPASASCTATRSSASRPTSACPSCRRGARAASRGSSLASG